jgi:uroporphyrinogen-III synthase
MKQKMTSPNKKKAVKKVVKSASSAAKKAVKKIAKKAVKKLIAKKVSASAKKIIASVPDKKVAAKKVSIPKIFLEVAPSNTTEKKARKSLKKPTIKLAPLPVIEISNHPKTKVRNVLVSQPKPVETDKNPYLDMGRKYNLNLEFRQFIKVEGLSSQDFRLQRIEILAYGAVILTSKLSVDHYFRMCNEMRVTVPDSMKFFCLNEQTAYYLQKYIQYRKRKIFFGHGTMLDLVDVIRKNKDEKFLLPVSDVHKEQIVEFLDELKIVYTKGVFYKTVSADLRDIKNLNEHDMLVFFTPAGIKSLKHNFPNFKQGNTRIAAFGHTAALKVKELGFRLDIFAPNPQNPSMTGAIEAYLKESNKR